MCRVKFVNRPIHLTVTQIKVSYLLTFFWLPDDVDLSLRMRIEIVYDYEQKNIINILYIKERL